MNLSPLAAGWAGRSIPVWPSRAWRCFWSALADFQRSGMFHTVTALDARFETFLPGLDRRTLPCDQVTILEGANPPDVISQLPQRMRRCTDHRARDRRRAGPAQPDSARCRRAAAGARSRRVSRSPGIRPNARAVSPGRACPSRGPSSLTFLRQERLGLNLVFL